MKTADRCSTHSNMIFILKKMSNLLVDHKTCGRDGIISDDFRVFIINSSAFQEYSYYVLQTTSSYRYYAFINA